MDLVRRFAGRVRASFERLLSEWDEADVADAACCAPDHLIPSEDGTTGGESSSDVECRCCAS